MTKTIYPYYVNSPETTLVDAISAYDVSFNVADGTKLPAAPNISNFGTGEDSETFRYTSLVGNLVSGVTRGFDISGNYGVAKPWGAGEVVARRWTAYDAEALVENATTPGSWGDSTITPTWSEGTPDITSTIARHVRNGNVVSFTMTFNISDGHDAVLDSIPLPVATSQIAGHQVPLSSFKLYSDGVDDVMSDPFAYVDFNAATPLIKLHNAGSFPDGCTAVLNISGSYEVPT